MAIIEPPRNRQNYCKKCLGRVESYPFSSASFSNSAPAEVDKGAEEHEGNPCVLRLSYTPAPPYSGYSRSRRGEPLCTCTSAPSSTSAIARVGGKREGANIHKGVKVNVYFFARGCRGS